MKKYDLFKITAISILVLFLLTWIIPTGTYDGAAITVGERAQMGFWDIFNAPNQAIGYFGNYLIFFALIGMFYGVLNKTGAYRNLLEKGVEVFKGKSNYFLIGVMVLLGIITSFTGLTFELFIFIPLIISVILLMGYDKIVAISATVGAILVGLIGSTYGYYGAGAINSVLGLEYSDQIWFKLFLLAVTMTLLVFYTLNYAKAVLKSKAKSKLEEASDDTLYLSKKKTKQSFWPVAIVFKFMFLITLLGFISWDNAFGIEIFNNFHTWIMGLHVGEFYMFAEVFGNATALGTWWIDDLSVLLFLMSILLIVIYKIKVSDALDGAWAGIKKMLPVIGIVLLINTAFVVVYNNQFNVVIMDWLLNLTDKFNLITMSLNSIVQSVVFVQLPYVGGFTLPAAMSVVTDTAVYSQIGVILQAMYGLIMFIAPTSLILFIGLAYTKVPYVKWFKYVWKLLVQLSLVVLAVITIMTLI